MQLFSRTRRKGDVAVPLRYYAPRYHTISQMVIVTLFAAIQQWKAFALLLWSVDCKNVTIMGV
jgi:hypothetical protein